MLQYQKPAFFAFLALYMTIAPSVAQAGILSIFGLENKADPESAMSHNAQTIPLPEASVAMADPKGGKGGPEVSVEDGALVADGGPLGTTADLSQEEAPVTDTISVYVVRKGDTLPIVAKMYGVSVNTIVWANDLSSKNAKLSEGQTLVILPISGLEHTVKKGETLASIAKKFKADAEEIGKFNGLELDSKLAVGDELIIPDGEIGTPQVTAPTKSKSKGTIINGNLPKYAYGRTSYQAGYGGADLGDFFTRPIAGGIRTQGLHGKEGIDIAAPAGTQILAAAGGTVIIAKDTGWNGGFGMYIVINHGNGIQTLYGHLSRVDVVPGQSVARGQAIGIIGSTGRSTGRHLHFETHGAKNPLGNNPSFGL
jgi:murein DD-endopeptidase MepM/ murein hydrolase activator NlpD